MKAVAPLVKELSFVLCVRIRFVFILSYCGKRGLSSGFLRTSRRRILDTWEMVAENIILFKNVQYFLH